MRLMRKHITPIASFFVTTMLTIASCSFLTILFTEGYYFALYLISCGLMALYSLETALFLEGKFPNSGGKNE